MERNRHLQGTIHLFYFPQIQMNCCPEGLVPPQPDIYIVNSYSQQDGCLPSWGSAVQPPYFPRTPVTFLTTNLNFCSSVDTLFLQLDGPSRVALVHCSTVWDTSQQQQVIQNILQGLGCHPFPSSYLIHSAHREQVGK